PMSAERMVRDVHAHPVRRPRPAPEAPVNRGTEWARPVPRLERHCVGIRSTFTRSGIAAATLCALLALAPSEARAQDAAQAALVLRILSYDRNLPSRASSQVTIVVLHRGGDSASDAEHRRMAAAL